MKIRELYKGNKPFAYVAFNYADAEDVECLLDSLDVCGYRYWFNSKLRPNERVLAGIEKKLNASSVTILVLTENAINDPMIEKVIEHSVEKRSTMIVYMTEEPRVVREYLTTLHSRITNCVVCRTWEQAFSSSNTVRQALEEVKGVTEAYCADLFENGVAVFNSEDPSVEQMSEAFKNITFAASNEYHPALHFLGEVALEKARNDEDSYSAAVAYFKAAIALGNADSIYRIGCMLADGEGFATNYQHACSYLSLSALQGNADAQYRFAKMLDNGLGVRLDREEASKWYQKALDNGDRRAYMHLGKRYLMGDTVKKDETVAAKYINEAANDGDKEALFVMAKLYRDGTGVKKDDEKSAYYFRKAAEAGICEAQYEYAMILLQTSSKNDKKDKNKLLERTEGFKWLNIAAREREYGKRPMPEVYYELGRCYSGGIGTEHNNTKAFMCYYKAANYGHTKAAEALAECYRKGLGVTVNKRAAAFYNPKFSEESM